MRIFRAARFLFPMGLRVDAVRLMRATVLAVALYVAAPLAAQRRAVPGGRAGVLRPRLRRRHCGGTVPRAARARLRR